MTRYYQILKFQIPWLIPNGGPLEKIVFQAIRYEFSKASVAVAWLQHIKEFIDKSARQDGAQVTTEKR